MRYADSTVVLIVEGEAHLKNTQRTNKKHTPLSKGRVAEGEGEAARQRLCTVDTIGAEICSKITILMQNAGNSGTFGSTAARRRPTRGGQGVVQIFPLGEICCAGPFWYPLCTAKHRCAWAFLV